MNVLYLGDKSIGSLGIIRILETSYSQVTIILKNMEEMMKEEFCESYDIGIIDAKILSIVQTHNIKKISRLLNFPLLILAKNEQPWHQYLNQMENVRGVIDCESDVAFFLNAINVISHGGYCYSWNMSSVNNSMLFNEEYYSSAGLTSREMEILKMYLKGSTNKEISVKLSRSEKTISAHKSNILRKIGVKRLPELSFRNG
ncbi:response regulator transcription factor [Jinshanibacter sp. LJY008]|uniref:Response regulator transcription factor n=1 Tax=Limnobaculum eriocheiris TaxID=2897391 RepID=A0A9X1MWH2_9GAMM|nr:response regulator transcription factor [Limnobaculum eriocheiris]MCD1125475.1 response regulator transcription factor [Limnobaculum eriocheiris]